MKAEICIFQFMWHSLHWRRAELELGQNHEDDYRWPWGILWQWRLDFPGPREWCECAVWMQSIFKFWDGIPGRFNIYLIFLHFISTLDSSCMNYPVNKVIILYAGMPFSVCSNTFSFLIHGHDFFILNLFLWSWFYYRESETEAWWPIEVVI